MISTRREIDNALVLDNSKLLTVNQILFPHWWIKLLKDKVQNSVVNNTLSIANNWLIIGEDDSVH